MEFNCHRKVVLDRVANFLLIRSCYNCMDESILTGSSLNANLFHLCFFYLEKKKMFLSVILMFMGFILTRCSSSLLLNWLLDLKPTTFWLEKLNWANLLLVLYFCWYLFLYSVNDVNSHFLSTGDRALKSTGSCTPAWQWNSKHVLLWDRNVFKDQADLNLLMLLSSCQSWVNIERC
jgi:hypothetical protein